MKITKKAIEANRSYDHAKATNIWEVYKKPSVRKEIAYWEIFEEMARLGGHGLRITGASYFFFSCAYVLADKLIYHTHKNRYEYPRIIQQ